MVGSSLNERVVTISWQLFLIPVSSYLMTLGRFTWFRRLAVILSGKMIWNKRN
jgi:hypothetical protein